MKRYIKSTSDTSYTVQAATRASRGYNKWSDFLLRNYTGKVVYDDKIEKAASNFKIKKPQELLDCLNDMVKNNEADRVSGDNGFIIGRW